MLGVALAAFCVAALLAQAPQTPVTPPAPQQPSEIQLVISGEPGTPPRYAVPDFVALSPDAADIAKTLGQVLWDDLNFEREFYMIPRDTYATIPVARTAEEVPFAAWRELGADAVVFGTVQKTDANTIRVQVRLFNVRSRQSVFAKEYTGAAATPRLYAHTVSDEIHQQQRALRGVARTKLSYSSDRNRERIAGPVQNRDVKEVYIADYDGENPRRVTTNRQLNIFPAWAPDARAIAYTSYRRGYPDIFIALIYQGLQETPTNGVGQNWLPVFSPDGTRICFYVEPRRQPGAYRDEPRRLRTCAGLRTTRRSTRRQPGRPTARRSPSRPIGPARRRFTSSAPTGSTCVASRRASRTRIAATWAPAPFNEIAFAARTGPGYDIKVYDLAGGDTRQITFGEGSNESPAYSPNGRHIAFTSTRGGRGTEVYTMGRDGKNVRQLTRDGNNYTPAWSN